MYRYYLSAMMGEHSLLWWPGEGRLSAVPKREQTPGAMDTETIRICLDQTEPLLFMGEMSMCVLK